MHAAALQRLDEVIKDDSNVLDVGSGSGYLTACLSHMAPKGKVIGLEYVKEVFEQGKQNINKHHSKLLNSGAIKLIRGDGWQGSKANGPYDAIHVGASAAELPIQLFYQLSIRGRIIIPIGTNRQALYQIDKKEDGKMKKTKLMDVVYVPLVRSDSEL